MRFERWDTYHCLLLLVASVGFIFVHSLLLFVIPALVSFLMLFYINHEELKTLKPYAGWANLVTTIRMFAIIVLALVHHSLPDLTIACVLLVIISLDGLDGYLARKRGEQTSMGAYFDMEADVIFVCLVSCMLFLRGHSGGEILIIGFFRYFYVLLIYLLGLRHIKEQRTRVGPVIAVFVFITITVSFVIPEGIRKVLIHLALILLIISFSHSFWLLVKKRNSD